VAAADLLGRDPRRSRSLVSLLVVVGGICGVLGVLEMLQVIPGEFPRWGTRFYRAALGLGQPNGLGLFLAALLPLGVHCWNVATRPAQRAVAGFSALAIALGIIATFSRGSWLALMGGTVALLLVGDAWRALRVWLGAAVLALLADLASGGALWDTAQRTLVDWTLEQRAALMYAGLLMFQAHPFVGVGPGGYAESLDEFGPQISALWDYLPTPHNAYVQMAAECGIIGLVALLAFLGAIFRILVRRVREADRDPRVSAEERSLRRALLWSFATACLAGMAMWPFAHGTGQVVMLVAALGVVNTEWREAAA
jgi:O-antigen ligase